ncbi:hypothetical protein RBB50_002460 [Rhinocladiella similis]
MAARDVTEVGTALPKHVEALEIAKAHPDVETNNFHGLNLKILLVFVSIDLIAFAQTVNLVGSGAPERYASDRWAFPWLAQHGKTHSG